MNLPTLPKGVATCNPLNFENTSFEVIDRDGFTWLRGLQVASALGYKNPAQDFKNLYARSADEMTALVELPTKGGIQQVRIFSPRGCHLLAMLAKTPKAKAFRRWVLDVLEGKAAADKLAAVETRLARMEAALYSDRPFWPVIMACKAAGLTQAQMLGATGYRATSTIRRNLRRMERYGLSPQMSLFAH